MLHGFSSYWSSRDECIAAITQNTSPEHITKPSSLIIFDYKGILWKELAYKNIGILILEFTLYLLLCCCCKENRLVAKTEPKKAFTFILHIITWRQYKKKTMSLGKSSRAKLEKMFRFPSHNHHHGNKYGSGGRGDTIGETGDSELMRYPRRINRRHSHTDLLQRAVFSKSYNCRRTQCFKLKQKKGFYWKCILIRIQW